MLKIKIGDYFNVYQEGKPTQRMIATSNSPDLDNGRNYCDAMTINPVCYYLVDANNEVEYVIGNIFIPSK
jgi:hypothetical protein